MIIYAKNQLKRVKTDTRSSPTTEKEVRNDSKNRENEKEEWNEEERERGRKRRETKRKRKRKNNRQTDRQQTDRIKNRQTERQTNRKRDNQEDRQPDRKQRIRKNGRMRDRRRNQRRDTYYKRSLRIINLWMLSPLLQPPDAYTPPFECPAPRPTAETEDLTRRESQVGSDRAAAETMMDIKDGKTGERRAVIRIGSSATSFLSPGRGGQTSPGQGCQLGPNHRLGRKDRSTMPVLQKRREVRAASAIARQLVHTSPGGLAVRDRGIGSTEPDLLISISTNGRSKEGSNVIFENAKRRARRTGLTKRHCWMTGVRMGEALKPGPRQWDDDLRKPLVGDSDGFESISEASSLSSDDEKDREEDSVPLGGSNDEFEQISESSSSSHGTRNAR